MTSFDLTTLLVVLFVVTQLLYSIAFLIDAYFFSRPVNWVEMGDTVEPPATLPYIVLFYPVLDELETVMRTTFGALARIDYPRDRFEVVAIPNADDRATVEALERIRQDFPFLRLLLVPPTTEASWNAVWSEWDANQKAYWWHRGSRAGDRTLPPKKTRQLIYAFYTLAEERRGGEDFLVNYLDADSAPPIDHFKAAAYGMRDYDVLQATNVAGNLNASLAASLHAFDHMTWDGRKYAHMSADGRHPYWVLGKGLYFRASDLIALGGFHPWITIEDPEVGLRFWKNGRRLGIIAAPLIEEVPETFGRGITQRKRWVAGFWQSLTVPLKELDFSLSERLRAWCNFLPCLSLAINLIGLPVGIWAVVTWFQGTSPLPVWTLVLAAINLAAYLLTMVTLYWATWKRTAIVLPRRRERLWYMLLINPVILWVWWAIWLIPLWIGWRMYRRDTGLVWERTEKIDANAALVRRQPGSHDEPVNLKPAEQRV